MYTVQHNVLLQFTELSVLYITCRLYRLHNKPNRVHNTLNCMYSLTCRLNRLHNKLPRDYNTLNCLYSLTYRLYRLHNKMPRVYNTLNCLYSITCRLYVHNKLSRVCSFDPLDAGSYCPLCNPQQPRQTGSTSYTGSFGH